MANRLKLIIEINDTVTRFDSADFGVSMTGIYFPEDVELINGIIELIKKKHIEEKERKKNG